MRYWPIVLLGLFAGCTTTAQPNRATNSDQDFEALLQRLEKDKDKAAIEALADPQTTSVSFAVEAPAEPQTSTVPEIPLTAAEEAGIRTQVEKNWDLQGTTGAPGLENILVLIRVALTPDGTITDARIINKQDSSYFRAVAESCLRAVRMSSPLKMPPGKTYSAAVLRFRPAEASLASK